MKVLLPILSKKENDSAFLERATKSAKEVILLLVIDTGAMHAESGFATAGIQQGNALLKEVKTILGKKRKNVSEVMEWGSTAAKITNLAKLRQADSVVLRRQDNQYFGELVAELRGNGLKVEVI